MSDQQVAAPDNTAVRVALWRALRVEVDAPPHVLEDEVGLKLAAPDDEWRSRPDMSPFTRPFRASIVARARFIEDLVAEQAGRGVGQYVILGAGLDTFAQRRPELACRLLVFEIDRPLPQAWKRRRLVELGLGITLLVLAACATGGQPASNLDARDADAAQRDASAAEPLEGLATDWQVRAAGYLEPRSASWLESPPDIANVKCALSCHTTFSYLLARPSLAPFATTVTADAVRARLEARVSEAVAGTAVAFYGQNADDKVKQSHATESVLNAAALALDDLGNGEALSASSKSALDRMWSQQRADGTWDWLEFGLEPWETRNDFGAAIAALVAGSVPADSTTSQAAGMTKLAGYVQKQLGNMVLHDRAMVLYASSKLAALLQPAQAEEIAADLAATQLADGGFSLGAWGQGGLASKVAKKSDGYATAVAVLALCTGMPDGAERPDVKRALGWLAHNQAEDGSWPGQSVNDTTEQVKSFMTDAATAYASIAITLCTPAKE